MLGNIQKTTEAPRIIAKTARDRGAIRMPRFAKTEIDGSSVHVESTRHFVGHRHQRWHRSRTAYVMA
jgi:hypothetical protein